MVNENQVSSLAMVLRSAPHRTPVSRRERCGHILKNISTWHLLVGDCGKENPWIIKRGKCLEVKKKWFFGGRIS